MADMADTKRDADLLTVRRALRLLHELANECQHVTASADIRGYADRADEAMARLMPPPQE